MSVLPAGRLGGHLAPAEAFDALTLRTGGAGLVLGVNQHGEPVIVSPFRAEPTRLVAVGSLTFAQLIAFRALGVGAQVLIQSARPDAWGTFARITGTPNDAVRLVPPDTSIEQPAQQDRPRLVVVDGGPSVGGAEGSSGAGWTATLAVREELTAWDVDVLRGADLALLQPLSPTEATLAASVLGLTEMKGSLSGIRADLVTLVGHGTVRWTLVEPTALERQLIGVPLRR
jgi:hypothetical protein